MLQALAQGPVDAEQVGRDEALAVRRVGYHQRLLGWILEILDVAAFHGDAVGYAGALGVGQRRLDGALVQVVAVNLVRKLALCRIVIVNTVQELAVEVFPFLETVSLAEHAGINVARHECRLDQQGPGAAERVHEVGLPVPARQFQQTGRQHLVNRRLDRRRTIAAQVQALAGSVQREGALLIGDVHVELDVGVGDTDIGAFARCLAEIIHDGVFHFIGNELGMPELLGIDYGVHRKGGIQIQIATPVDAADRSIDVVGILCREVLDRLEDSDRSAQTEIRTIHHFLITGKGDHAAPRPDVVRTELVQLLGQDFFQTLKSLGDEFKFFH